MSAVGKMILFPSWNNGILITPSLYMVKIFFTRGVPELNFKREVAPSPLREEECGLFLNCTSLLGRVKYL